MLIFFVVAVLLASGDLYEEDVHFYDLDGCNEAKAAFDDYMLAIGHDKWVRYRSECEITIEFPKLQA